MSLVDLKPMPRVQLALRVPRIFEDVREERRHRQESLVISFRFFGRFGFEDGIAGHITARDHGGDQRTGRRHARDDGELLATLSLSPPLVNFSVQREARITTSSTARATRCSS